MKNHILPRLFLVLLGLFLSLPVFAEELPDGVRTGKLPNGLTYYLFSDGSFKGETNFVLLQNVGSILEENSEDGIAHFLEHLAFGQTEHFPSGLMTTLRDRIGDSFSAYTGQDQTTYSLYGIPSDNPDLVSMAFDVLHDWAHGVKITPQGVEKERGIIMEEWRSREGVSRRLSWFIAPYVYNYSKYGERQVIGTPETISSFTPEMIRAFYDKWYRPELQCIIIVGDFDLDLYEKKILTGFSDLRGTDVKNLRVRTEIKDNPEPLFGAFSDPENVSDSFGIYQRVAVSADEKTNVRENLLTMIFNRLIAQRISGLRAAGVDKFVAATMTYSPIVRGYSQGAWDVVPFEGKEKEALDQIVSLRETIRRTGFGENEFDAVKEAIFKDLNGLIKSDDPVGTSDNWIDIFRQNYLYGIPVRSMADALRNNVETLVEIENDDLTDWIRSWMGDEKNIAFLTYADTKGGMPLTLDDFKRAVAKAKTGPDLVLPEAPVISGALIDFPVTPGKIVSEKVIPGLEAKEWTLSNGARLVFKNVPEMEGKTFFVASAMGGLSVIDPEDLPSYYAMQSLVLKSGLYKYSRESLSGWLSKKDIEANLSIDNFTDGFGGNADTEHLGDLLSYAYLFFTHQNFDRNTYDRFVERARFVAEKSASNPAEAVNDSVSRILFPPSPLNPVHDTRFFDAMKYEDLERLYADKFGNAADFTFALVGDLSEADAKTLAEKYIASLPGKPGTTPRTFKPMDFTAPDTVIEREIVTDLPGNSGRVRLSYLRDQSLSEREEKALTLFEYMLNFRLFTVLREEESGIYSVSARAVYTKVPVPSTNVDVFFETESDKVDYLKGKALDVLASFSDGTFSDDDFKKARLQLASGEMADIAMDEDADVDPLIWLALLNAYVENGSVKSPTDAGKPSVLFSDLTPGDVQAVARKVLQDGKRRSITVKSAPAKEGSWERSF